MDTTFVSSVTVSSAPWFQDINDHIYRSAPKWCGTAGGTADAITVSAVSTNLAITAYLAGQSYMYKSGASVNTTAMTVAVDGLATKAIQKNGSAMIAGDHPANKWFRITYDGTDFQIEQIYDALVGGLLSVAQGGTNLASGISGGVLAYTATGTLASSAALGAGNIVVGGGAGVVPTSVSAGATTEVLVGGGAATAPVWTTATGSGAPARATSPTFVTPLLGTPTSGVLTNCTGLPTAGIVDAAVTLAKMANLAQDQFIGRTTASTGVPETATVTAAARTVLDDITVAAMVDTLGGAISTGTGGIVRATSPTLVTPALGTPSSGTATNLTGTAASLTAGNVITNANLTGHVTSTGNGAVLGSFTLAQLNTAVSDADVASIAGTETLTNKRVTPRILSAASYTTDTGTSLNIDNLDEFIVTAQAGALLFNNPTGTPTDGQVLLIAVTGTAARALTYGTQFEASTVALPTTTVTTARLNMGFIWRADTSKWVIVGSA